MNKSVKTNELFDCQVPYLVDLFNECEFPWQIVSKISNTIGNLISESLDGFTEVTDGVFIGENVTISPTATLIGPAIIGNGTEIRPGAYIRGNVITGENCVIGNSCELKNCILLDKVQVPHYNYVGDSILGNRAHMGAGAICSNFKTDGKAVVVRGDKDYETGLRKLGGILGDGADIGCGCVLNPGTVIGKGTSAYPLNSLRGVFPSGCIIKNPNDVVERVAKL